jgi:hypothetical protein
VIRSRAPPKQVTSICLFVDMELGKSKTDRGALDRKISPTAARCKVIMFVIHRCM